MRVAQARWTEAAGVLACVLLASCSLLTSLDDLDRGSNAPGGSTSGTNAGGLGAGNDGGAGGPGSGGNDGGMGGGGRGGAPASSTGGGQGGAAPKPTYSEVVLSDKPVGYWRLGEAIGPTANPAVGLIEGTYFGSCTFGATGAIVGDADTAVLLDGMTARVKLGDGLDFSGTSPFSLEAWVMPSLIDSGYRRIFSKELFAPDRQGYDLLVNATGIGFERWRDGAAGAAVTGAPPIGVYSHVVGTYDGVTMVIYVAGAPAGNGPGNVDLLDTVQPLTVGMSSVDADGFAGTVDEVAIYDKALTPDRVKAHHDAGLGMFP